MRQLAESVNWEEKELKAEQEKARQLAAARAALANGWTTPMGATVPVDRVRDVDSYLVVEFSANDAKDRILIEQGGCGPHCECFGLVYFDNRSEWEYRPDTVNAPNVCLACLNRNAHIEKRNALGTVEDNSDETRVQREAAAETKRQIEALNNAAQEVWQRWLREQDKHALWNNIVFWRVLARSAWQLEPILKAAPDVQTACSEMLNLLYRGTREYDRDLGAQVHIVAKVDALIKALGGATVAGIEQIGEEEEEGGGRMMTNDHEPDRRVSCDRHGNLRCDCGWTAESELLSYEDWEQWSIAVANKHRAVCILTSVKASP